MFRKNRVEVPATGVAELRERLAPVVEHAAQVAREQAALAKEQAALARKALGRSAGFLRSAIAPRLHMKRIPELTFFPDTTLEQGNKMDALFQEIQKEREAEQRRLTKEEFDRQNRARAAP